MNRLIYIFLFIPILGFSQIQPQIGDLREGGIVFYIDYDENFMMISAPTDMSIDDYSNLNNLKGQISLYTYTFQKILLYMTITGENNKFQFEIL